MKSFGQEILPRGEPRERLFSSLDNVWRHIYPQDLVKTSIILDSGFSWLAVFSDNLRIDWVTDWLNQSHK